MELSGLLPVLVLFILLVGVRETGLVEGSLRDSCPKIKVNCKYRERNQCQQHRDCPKKMKCCDFSCGKKCVNPKQDLCSLPEDGGPCKGYRLRYWYDKVVNFCIAFIYGGCLGNNNNFQSEDICMKVCKKKYPPMMLPSSVCSLPKEKGRCQASITWWFYNSNTGKCEEFVYGSCSGNNNNFLLKNMCYKTCEET